MKLCIAEKPSVAKEIATILGANLKKDGYFEGNGYWVSWTFRTSLHTQRTTRLYLFVEDLESGNITHDSVEIQHQSNAGSRRSKTIQNHRKFGATLLRSH
jgi:DNA topoisomerase IA